MNAPKRVHIHGLERWLAWNPWHMCMSRFSATCCSLPGSKKSQMRPKCIWCLTTRFPSCLRSIPPTPLPASPCVCFCPGCFRTSSLGAYNIAGGPSYLPKGLPLLSWFTTDTICHSIWNIPHLPHSLYRCPSLNLGKAKIQESSWYLPVGLEGLQLARLP